jgi:hypothetical protein
VRAHRSPAFRWCIALVVGAAVCAMPGALLAQSVSDGTGATLADALRPGDRVTVSLPGDVTIKGRFVQVSPEALIVSVPRKEC